MMEAPRKLSSDSDECKKLLREGYAIAVMLNGERVERVLSYDMDEGTVTLLVVDENGMSLIKGDSWESQTLHGTVSAHVFAR